MSKSDLDCSLIYALEILGKKWNTFIIAELMMQNRRLTFSEIQESLIGNYNTNISSRVLTDKLTTLERSGIIQRIEERRGHVYYNLTESGDDLEVVFAALKSWAIKHGGIAYDDCKHKTCIHKTVDFFEFHQLENLLNP